MRRRRYVEEEPEREETSKRFLMYRGREYPNFLKEATMLGVSRNIPLRSLANLRWDDEILMGTFHSYGKHEDSTETKKDGSLKWPNGKPVNLGEARIDCSFILKEIMIQNPRISQAVADKIIRDPNIVKSVIPGRGEIVYRGCGWYELGNAYEIITTVRAVYEAILEVQKELDLKKIKIMIGGPLKTVFPPGTGLFDAVFTRGITAIETSGFDFTKQFESEHDGKNLVIRIHKYTPVKGTKYCDTTQRDLGEATA